MYIRIIFVISLILMTFKSLFVYAGASDNSKAKQKLDINSLTTPGVTDNEILLGSVLPLEGRAAGLGQQIRIGLDKALADQIINGRRVHIIYADDLYEPLLTRLRVIRLLKQGIFAMVGNFGTPTAAITLPLLKQASIPAVGFFTGAGLLRTGDGPVLNFRASYAQEIAAVIAAALQAGLKPEQVCAYVQNDDYGKSGLLGLQEAMLKAQAPNLILNGIKELLAGSNKDQLVKLSNADKTPINENGPVGVYIRNSIEVMSGYTALKKWEQKTGYECKLVVAVGIYDNIAHFVHTTRSLGENWIISAVSFVGADNLLHTLQELENINKYTVNGDLYNILMTQVVPSTESELPIVQEAHKFLDKDFGFVSLEAYIVGKMVLELLNKTPNPLTQSYFLSQAKQENFDIGGLTINFTRNGYQGSDFVTITKLTTSGFHTLQPNDWQTMLAWQIPKTIHPNTKANAVSNTANTVTSTAIATSTNTPTNSAQQPKKTASSLTSEAKVTAKKSTKTKTASKPNTATKASEKTSAKTSNTTTNTQSKKKGSE